MRSVSFLLRHSNKNALLVVVDVESIGQCCYTSLAMYRTSLEPWPSMACTHSAAAFSNLLVCVQGEPVCVEYLMACRVQTCVSVISSTAIGIAFICSSEYVNCRKPWSVETVEGVKGGGEGGSDNVIQKKILR